MIITYKNYVIIFIQQRGLSLKEHKMLQSDNQRKYRDEENHELEKQQSVKTDEDDSYYKKQRKCIYFVITWIIFFLAFGIYMAIFALDRYVGVIQESYFYASSQKISPYIYSSTTQQSACNFAVSSSTSSQAIFTTTQRASALALALPLIYHWIMWKFPLNVYTLDVIWVQENKILRFVPWIAVVIIELAFDVLLFIFVPTYYNDWYFYALSFFLSFILIIINNRGNLKAGMAAIFFPLFFIALLYACYTYFFPALFGVYLTDLPEAAPFLQIYLFPLFDLAIYILFLLMNAHISKLATKFLSYVNFLMLGYFVGMTVLVGITEVEFYYLLAYLFFRNFFVNWVMWRWEHIVNMNSVLPGWLLPYYLSYLLNFVPLVGLGQLTISAGFKTAQFSEACLLLYYIPSSLFFYDNPSNTSVGTDINYQLLGYIFWPGALMIWAFSTFSTTYPRMKPSAFDFFYMLIGIYLFYIGLSAALQIAPLSQVAMKA